MIVFTEIKRNLSKISINVLFLLEKDVLEVLAVELMVSSQLDPYPGRYPIFLRTALLLLDYKIVNQTTALRERQNLISTVGYIISIRYVYRKGFYSVLMFFRGKLMINSDLS